MCIGGLAAACTWLCWRLVDQDRKLESQRIQEYLDQCAERTAARLETGIRDVEAWLPGEAVESAEPLPDGIAVVKVSNRGVNVHPASAVLYVPPPVRKMAIPDDAFAAGEQVEFEADDPTEAAARFRELVNSSNPDVRAGALVRMARNLRKVGHHAEALRAYDQLALIRTASVEGIPADLTALYARCKVLDTMHRRGDLVRQALVINDGLRGRRWELTGAAWEFYESEARRWAGTLLTDLERQSLAVSRATEWLSEHWPRPLEAQGRRILTVKDGPVLVSWSARDTHLGAIVISPERLQRIWKEAVAEPGTQTALTDSSGTAVMGSLSTGPRAVRSPAVFAMPAALVLTSTVSDASQAAVLLRRRFLIAAFAMLLAAVGTGSYFTLRSMARESAAARLQSEFVASVSHELRTPLTSLRQLSEMLMQDRIPTDAERRQSYAVLFQASQRLHRLVESLLDLGRMEAAEFRYQFAPVDPRALAARVVEEFRVQAAPGRDLVLTQPDHLPSIQADSEALAVALWNLLDNAVKYSPESEAVRIETAEVDAKVSIAVRDGGCGIEQADHERIFDRFVRGASAIRSNIKGTGIGLSMARHIVRANGGEILLNSEPGLGSTFTILIPTETPE